MRTPSEMADQINSMNCHALAKSPVEKDGKTYDPSEVGYGPVTVAQMEAIYAEARKIEWTDNKPDRAGWWWYRWEDGSEEPLRVWYWAGELVAGGFRSNGYEGQWSTRPIDMPEEARKELSKG